MGIRYIMSFIGYCFITVALNIIAIETQSQLVAILFWLMIAIFVINIFRSISWGVHIIGKQQWKGIILRYFLNSFIPKELFHDLFYEFKKNKDGAKYPIFIFGMLLISYYVKQETEWTFFSILFWITFAILCFQYLYIYYDAGEKELGNIVYNDHVGFFKAIGFFLSFWFFLTGVFEFSTIQKDTMPKYATTLVFMSKEYIINTFSPSRHHSGNYYDDEDEEPLIHSHTGRE